MRYLRAFTFPNSDAEWAHAMGIQRKCYNSFYPFGVLTRHQLTRLELSPLTVLYGGNGSGKTTALNVMAEKLHAQRDSRYNRSSFFEDYLALCTVEGAVDDAETVRILTSDDVFDFMLNLRAANEGIDLQREKLFREWVETRYDRFQLRSMEDYEQLKKVVESRQKTQSRYARDNAPPNIAEHSNGESAFAYFTDKLGDNGLYFLDEPENSLSPVRQQELAGLLTDAVRFFGCQCVIATHSPFLLAMRGAIVYDLDANPVCLRPWTALPNVLAYRDFFQAHAAEFTDDED